MSGGPGIVRRGSILLRPDASRVIARPLLPGHDYRAGAGPAELIRFLQVARQARSTRRIAYLLGHAFADRIRGAAGAPT